MNKNNFKNEFLNCPLPINTHKTIQLSHGSGGKLTQELISKIFVPVFNNEFLNKQDDQAVLNINGQKFAFTTDSFVVDPIFFPGGDIGDLAVNGTINDICTCGAKPLFLSVGMILEEGFPIEDLNKITISMQKAAIKANVQIVTGDTKVVDKGKGDKIFINTSGIGIIEHNYDISSRNLQTGDKIIINGTIADHGITILSQREGLTFESDIQSDTASLNNLVETILTCGGNSVHAMRDPTRGGVAATLNEFAANSKMSIIVEQSSLPIKPSVNGAAEILGIDPLYIANEGKIIVAAAADKTDEILAVMKKHPDGKDAAIIGTVNKKKPGLVTVKTLLGSERILDMPVGEQLPRIC